MVIYDAPGEVRVTADHIPVEIIGGRVLIELVAPYEFRVLFRPAKGRIARKGWHWVSPYSAPRFVRARVCTAGEEVCDLSHEVEGWWVEPRGSLVIEFYEAGQHAS